MADPQDDNSLFRSEALLGISRRGEGAVFLALPPLTARLSLVLTGLVFTAALTCSFIRFPSTVSGRGILTPQGGIVRVVADRGGLVRELHVEDGSHVFAGQPIASIALADNSGSNNPWNVRENAAREELEAAALAADLRADQLSLSSRIAKRNAVSLRQELSQVESQIGLMNGRITLAEEQARNAEEIAARGYLTRSELLRRQDQLLSLKSEHLALSAAAEGLRRQIAEQEESGARSEIERQAASATATETRARLGGQLAQLQADGRYLVSAPRAGVLTLVPNVGSQHLNSGGAIGFIAGPGKAVAELLMPASDVGLIAAGQPATVGFDTLPQRRFGRVRGKVLGISATALPSADLISSTLPQGSYFRVNVEIDAASLRRRPEFADVRPGTPVEARITVDRRSFWDWLSRTVRRMSN